MKVLVIGAGQVGTFAAEALAKLGCTVMAADLTPDLPFFRRFAPTSNAPLMPMDVLSAESIDACLFETLPETIVMTFGVNGISFEQHEQANEINIDGPCQVAAQAIKFGKTKRIVYLSSFAVYGRQSVDTLNEDSELLPDTPYGQAKLSTERSLVELCKGKIDLRIVRPCGLYGPLRHGNGSHSAKLIDALLLAAAHDKPVKLEWTPADRDQYIYVLDLANAIAQVGTLPDANTTRAYNVGTGETTTAADLVQSVRETWPNFQADLIEIESNGRCMFPVLDVRRAQEELSFVAKFDLTTGMRNLAKTKGLLP